MKNQYKLKGKLKANNKIIHKKGRAIAKFITGLKRK